MNKWIDQRPKHIPASQTLMVSFYLANKKQGGPHDNNRSSVIMRGMPNSPSGLSNFLTKVDLCAVLDTQKAEFLDSITVLIKPLSDQILEIKHFFQHTATTADSAM